MFAQKQVVKEIRFTTINFKKHLYFLRIREIKRGQILALVTQATMDDSTDVARHLDEQ